MLQVLKLLQPPRALRAASCVCENILLEEVAQHAEFQFDFVSCQIKVAQCRHAIGDAFQTRSLGHISVNHNLGATWDLALCVWVCPWLRQISMQDVHCIVGEREPGEVGFQDIANCSRSCVFPLFEMNPRNAGRDVFSQVQILQPISSPGWIPCTQQTLQRASQKGRFPACVIHTLKEALVDMQRVLAQEDSQGLLQSHVNVDLAVWRAVVICKSPIATKKKCTCAGQHACNSLAMVWKLCSKESTAMPTGRVPAWNCIRRQVISKNSLLPVSSAPARTGGSKRQSCRPVMPPKVLRWRSPRGLQCHSGKHLKSCGAWSWMLTWF